MERGEDPYHLERFVSPQSGVYPRALAEIRAGSKRSHWMWFIFPQIEGLGRTPTSRLYSIKSLDEARAYLAHPVLGPRLVECAEAALQVPDRTAHEIFGSPDDLKLRSSATLFAEAAGEPSVFHRLLDRFYEGKPDERTLELLHSHATGGPP